LNPTKGRTAVFLLIIVEFAGCQFRFFHAIDTYAPYLSTAAAINKHDQFVEKIRHEVEIQSSRRIKKGIFPLA
jgi:hypothetical protein